MRAHAREVGAPGACTGGAHGGSRTQLTELVRLQRSVGNRAVGRLLAAGLPVRLLRVARTARTPRGCQPVLLQRDPTTAPTTPVAPAPPHFASVDEAATAVVTAVAESNLTTYEAAKQFALSHLNGLNPEGMVAELATVHRLDALYKILSNKPAGFDLPRLSTGVAGVMSHKTDDTVAALQLLDQLRSTGGSEAFWTENIEPLSATRLRQILLVADRTVLVALRDQLDKAPPKVHAKVGPVLGRLFDPPASEIVLEFVPDQFDQPAVITRPDGTTGPGLAPIGVLTAKVAGRVAAVVSAQGGMWQSQDAGGGHHADPTKPGTHLLGMREKVRTSFWVPSQLAQGTPLREVTKKGVLAVEYQGDDGRWHDTRSLPKPITRDDILGFVTGLRNLLNGEKAAQDLIPDGVVPPTWIFNDFGDHAYRILGTDQLVHTSPNQEVEHRAGIGEALGWSHGCLHLKPSGRDFLEGLNLLKGGVTLKVHAYVKGVKEYGVAPGFG